VEGSGRQWQAVAGGERDEPGRAHADSPGRALARLGELVDALELTLLALGAEAQAVNVHITELRKLRSDLSEEIRARGDARDRAAVERDVKADRRDDHADARDAAAQAGAERPEKDARAEARGDRNAAREDRAGARDDRAAAARERREA